MKIDLCKKCLGILLLVLVFCACVADDDFEVPNSSGEQNNIPSENQIVEISDVINDFIQNEEEIFNYGETDKFMEAYVVSSDESGNFFNELIVQDKVENPTAGIRIGIAVNSLYTRYQIGQKIYVALNGFSVGNANGVVSLGLADGEYMEEAPSQFEEKIIRDPEIAEIVPLSIEINQFSNEYENLFVQLNQVQFPEGSVLGDDVLSFAGEAFDEFDGERKVESCIVNSTFTLSTSTFADFKNLDLPQKSGEISGVLSRNFEDTFYVLRINDVAGVAFDEERCESIGFNCGLADVEGSTILFEEDFESQSANDEVSGNGWTNYVEIGTSKWEVFMDNTNSPSMGKGTKVDPSSVDESSIAWLITPSLNLAPQNDETLSFVTSNSFADQSDLQVLISFDWDGNEETISSATWKNINAATIVNDDDDFRNLISSGNLDLSCAEDSAHIAFKYIGSGQDEFDGAYELDDIKVAY